MEGSEIAKRDHQRNKSEIVKFSELSKKEGFFAEYENNQKKLQELEVEWKN